MSIFDDVTDSIVKQVEREPLPSFAQYLKSVKSAELTQLFNITVVWLPCEWSNITLETHKFRLRIQDNDPLYPPLLTTFTDAVGKPDGLCIKVMSQQAKTFKLLPSKRNLGVWVKLGKNGLIYKSQ